jgi:hypothetical protein
MKLIPITLFHIIIPMASAFTIMMPKKTIVSTTTSTSGATTGSRRTRSFANTNHSSNLYQSKIETFEKAVECAENFGYCDLEELEQLAEELESFHGNFFEHDENHPQWMEKEIEDRKDVAEILRLQEELRLRMDYLDKANLFAKDMHDEVKEEGEVIW